MANSDPKNDSLLLPLRKWVLLADSVELIARHLGCSHEGAREYVAHAIKDGITRLRGTFDDEPNDRLHLKEITATMVLNSHLDWQTNTIHLSDSVVLDSGSSWTYDSARDLEVEIDLLFDRIADRTSGGTGKGTTNDDSPSLCEGEQAAHHFIDQSRTGYPGRPSISHLILEEFRRRAAAGEALPTLAKEAEALRAWADEAHPRLRRPTPGTIETQIRIEHRQFRHRKA